MTDEDKAFLEELTVRQMAAALAGPIIAGLALDLDLDPGSALNGDQSGAIAAVFQKMMEAIRLHHL